MDKTVKQIDGELSALRVKEMALTTERDKLAKVEQQKKLADYIKYKGKFVWYKNGNAKNWKLGIFKKTSFDWDDKLIFNIENVDDAYDAIKVAMFDDVKTAIYTVPKKETK
jgi:hypothetical protein